MPDPLSSPQATPELKEQLECAFHQIGIEVGLQIKAIVEAEIQAHLCSITNLNKVLGILTSGVKILPPDPQSSGDSAV